MSLFLFGRIVFDYRYDNFVWQFWVCVGVFIDFVGPTLTLNDRFPSSVTLSCLSPRSGLMSAASCQVEKISYLHRRSVIEKRKNKKSAAAHLTCQRSKLDISRLLCPTDRSSFPASNRTRTRIFLLHTCDHLKVRLSKRPKFSRWIELPR